MEQIKTSAYSDMKIKVTYEVHKWVICGHHSGWCLCECIWKPGKDGEWKYSFEMAKGRIHVGKGARAKAEEDLVSWNKSGKLAHN